MKNTIDGTTWNDSLIGAVRAFRLGDLDTAEKRLDKAFTDGGTELPYLHLLAGHIAHSRGSAVEAEKAWKRVLELDPGNAEAWNNLGVLYRRYGDDKKALAAFEEAQERAPDRPDIPYNIGNLHKTAERWEQAVSAYNRSIEIDPDYAPAYNNLGTLYETMNRRDKALEVFRRGLSADSGDASIRFNMGLVYQEEERWEDAREAFDTALKSRPGWVPGLNNMGIVLQEMGREDEAARTFRSLLEIEPDNVSALNNLGVTYDRLGRIEDARKCFRTALKEEPNYVKAALNLHDSYHEGQELNEALEEINKQITHHPRDPEIRVRMGRTLMGLTRWDEAEQSLDHVLDRNPEHSEALRAKADLFLATKRPEEAETILKRLPHDPNVVRDLARLYMTTQRPAEAERLLRELLAVDPADAESHRLMAELLAESDPNKAAQHREEAAVTDPGDTDDLLSLADLYGKTGEKDLALGKLDEAMNLLGARGEAEDLDAMNEVLSLYETAAKALESEKSDLFSERTAQLGRKLEATMGPFTSSRSRGSRINAGEIPLEEEDALSLIDINAMEPIIRINEEEETIFLDESAEELDDAYTELERREAARENGRREGAAAAAAGNAGGGGFAAGEAPQGSSGPPVHIHLPPGGMPAQSAPQVIYQDIRPITRPEPESPEAAAIPVLEEIVEEEIPELPGEEIADEEMELLLDDEPGLSLVESIEEEEPDEEDEDDTPFFIPESDALSEDLPDEALPQDLDADLVFPEEEDQGDDSPLLEDVMADGEADGSGDIIEEDDTEPVESEILIEESDEPEFLMDVEAEPLELSEDDLVDEDELPAEPESLEINLEEDGFESLWASEEPEELELPEEPADEILEELQKEEPAPTEESADETDEEPDEDQLDSEKVAGMFKYLSNLTDETTGEGRQHLIEEGVPLKLAGLHAKLTGEPNFREVAQKYDRRSRERHNIELDPEKIQESLTAFKNLAEAFPSHSVAESLSQKLGKIMSNVGEISKKNAKGTADDKPEDKVPADDQDGAVPPGLIDGLAEEVDAAEDDDTSGLDDFAAVLPDQ